MVNADFIYVDIKGDNIFQELGENAIQIVSQFVHAEMRSPSPRKYVDGKPIYASREFDRPKVLARCLLGDFGSTVRGDKERNHGAQPDFFRAPEVILKANWSYPVDIWNVGALVCHIPLSLSLSRRRLTRELRLGCGCKEHSCLGVKILMDLRINTVMPLELTWQKLLGFSGFPHLT
jgi:serine/threonine protein kinase